MNTTEFMAQFLVPNDTVLINNDEYTPILMGKLLRMEDESALIHVNGIAIRAPLKEVVKYTSPDSSSIPRLTLLAQLRNNSDFYQKDLSDYTSSDHFAHHNFRSMTLSLKYELQDIERGQRVYFKPGREALRSGIFRYRAQTKMGTGPRKTHMYTIYDDKTTRQYRVEPEFVEIVPEGVVP